MSGCSRFRRPVDNYGVLESGNFEGEAVLNANNLKAALGGGVDEGNAADVGNINGQGGKGKCCRGESARLPVGQSIENPRLLNIPES